MFENRRETLYHNNRVIMENYNACCNTDDLNLCVSHTGAQSLQQNLSYTIIIDIHKKFMTSKINTVLQQTFFICHHQDPCSVPQSSSIVFSKFKYISKLTEIFKKQLGIINYRSLFRQSLENIQRIKQHLAQKDTQLSLTSPFLIYTSPTDLNSYPDCSNTLRSHLATSKQQFISGGVDWKLFLFSQVLERERGHVS